MSTRVTPDDDRGHMKRNKSQDVEASVEVSIAGALVRQQLEDCEGVQQGSVGRFALGPFVYVADGLG